MDTDELSGKPEEMFRGNLMMDWHPIQGGVNAMWKWDQETGIWKWNEISWNGMKWNGNWDQLWLDGPLGLSTDFTFLMLGVRDWPIISMLKGELRDLEVQDVGMSLCCVLRQDILLSEFLSPDKSRNGYN